MPGQAAELKEAISQAQPAPQAEEKLGTTGAGQRPRSGWNVPNCA